MVKTLTISGYNRPTYFAQVIKALAWCDGVGEYDVVAVLDPSDKTQDLAEIGQERERRAADVHRKAQIPSRRERSTDKVGGLGHLQIKHVPQGKRRSAR